MKSYIFITNEGYTYQPNSETIDPDVENCQVIGFSNGNNPHDAFVKFLKSNEYFKNTSFNEIFSIELKNENMKTYFSLDEYK